MGYVFENLKRGRRYGFEYLANHFDEVELFWAWWWETQANEAKLERPFTLDESDPILTPTISKEEVDTELFSDGFWSCLQRLLSSRVLPRGLAVPRHTYRQAIIEHFTNPLSACAHPLVVFAGGGYGAGKTTAMTYLAKSGVLGIGHGDMRGVDYCKMLLPEFERIKMVCDGRASSVCQDESRVIADALFPRLVHDRRSFGWDSSMSNPEETLKKIILARSAGYKLRLVAVWSPAEIAIRRAMRRARETKRFAHPDHLVPSARLFAAAFPAYVDHVDEVLVFDNSADGDPEVSQPLLIAGKQALEMELEVYDSERVQRFLSFGESV